MVELISKGPKATPGMTFLDWVIVSRYFSVAASISIAWVCAGLLLKSFEGGIEELMRDPADRARSAVMVWLLSAPLAVVFIWAAGVPMSLQAAALHLISRFGLVVSCAWCLARGAFRAVPSFLLAVVLDTTFSP